MQYEYANHCLWQMTSAYVRFDECQGNKWQQCQKKKKREISITFKIFTTKAKIVTGRKAVYCKRTWRKWWSKQTHQSSSSPRPQYLKHVAIALSQNQNGIWELSLRHSDKIGKNSKSQDKNADFRKSIL